MYSQILNQDPFTTVVSLDEAKTQCRVTHTFDDDYITALIPVACEMAQSYTRRLITPGSCVSVVECYQTSVLLPFGEVTDVTELLIDGEISTDFEFEEVTQKVSITTTLGFSKLKITYDCGYTVVPTAVKQAILMIISTLYNNRQDFVVGLTVAKIPTTSEMLLDTVKLHGI